MFCGTLCTKTVFRTFNKTILLIVLKKRFGVFDTIKFREKGRSRSPDLSSSLCNYFGICISKELKDVGALTRGRGYVTCPPPFLRGGRYVGYLFLAAARKVLGSFRLMKYTLRSCCLGKLLWRT